MAEEESFGRVFSNGVLQMAPRCLRIDGWFIANPTKEQLIENEYYPIIRSEMPVVPEEDRNKYYYSPKYDCHDEKIFETWNKIEIPSSEEENK